MAAPTSATPCTRERDRPGALDTLPGIHRDEQVTDGDSERMPLGHAQALQQAGYVRINGAASWRADWAAFIDSHKPPRTPAEMRKLTTVLVQVAEVLGLALPLRRGRQQPLPTRIPRGRGCRPPPGRAVRIGGAWSAASPPPTEGSR